ncbi:3-isopropylmalate dehydratase large subunit [Conexivisphaera calida]|uniref:3-isopropylmalate dehydratase large subunit n=2 Tax=Conexivisphaera calida TaxID=1874277 RepID=A0A4P2VFD8_9ARCH|nr:3-isopropylmalate dehydratase large subunit [Conexivisphaera calida]
MRSDALNGATLLGPSHMGSAASDMGMTITEKILALASGRQRVSAGDVVVAKVDRVMMHDVGAPGVWDVFQELKSRGVDVSRLFNPGMIWMTEDHFVPPPDPKSAENVRLMEQMADMYGIKEYYRFGLGTYGVCHTLAYEEALVLPGQVYVGTDSHTVTSGALGAFATGMGHTDVAYILLNGKNWFRVPETILFRLNGRLRDGVMGKDVILRILGDIGADGANYMAMEFAGDGVRAMPLEDRMTVTNMTVEAGAKNGIMAPDEQVIEYYREKGKSGFPALSSDGDAEYRDVHDYDLGRLEPMVAKPHSPANAAELSEVEGLEVDEAYLGSCTGGKYYDMVQAARILRKANRKAKTRFVVVPSTTNVYRRMLREGLLDVFLDAGAVVGPPTCGACIGGHMGVLGPDEVAVSSTNRNFPGRMGHRTSKVYLASPATVAASALEGRITDPRRILGGGN